MIIDNPNIAKQNFCINLNNILYDMNMYNYTYLNEENMVRQEIKRTIQNEINSYMNSMFKEYVKNNMSLIVDAIKNEINREYNENIKKKIDIEFV